ncbi:MAG: AMP-binding protein [Rhodobacteraceae bacterium]|nr:AMP-binding protein [Paracoccaceae bacterium]
MSNPLYDALFAPHLGAGTPFLHLRDGTTWTHARFLTLAAKYANALRAHGLTPGDRLAVQVAKSPEALALYAACVQAGVVFLPLNPAYTAAEVAYFVEDSGAKLLICDPTEQAALSIAGASTATLDADGRGSFADATDTQPGTFETAARAPNDLAALLYTSGTTGRSKGAMLTQTNLLSNAKVLTDLWQFTEDDCLLHALPIFHTHGLFVATNVMLLAGGPMIFLPRFDTDGYVQIVGRNKDLIISGGFNIYPKEVELALDALPGVQESAVIGVPHPDLGEAVVAVVVPEPNAEPDPQAISAALAESLARFKQPRHIFTVDALPRNTMGKVQKNRLRYAYAKTFAT